MENSRLCKDLPVRLSTFVDTFIDYCVSGHFLLPPPDPKPPLLTRLPSPDRLVAIGDLHGDLNKSKQAFRIAGLIDATDRWIGGATTVVQIGDVLDRGGDELKILYFLEKLKREATKSGGSVITMIGNHEIMNVDGDFRYVDPSAITEFQSWKYWFQIGNSMKQIPSSKIFDDIALTSRGNFKKEYEEGLKTRVAALRPGGPISTRFLSGNPTALVVGDSVFVHGGLLANHVQYGLEKINQEVRDWIYGMKGRLSPSFVRGRNSVVWLRKFSDYAEVCDCSALQHVLATIPGAKRMIMGHTIQEMGINGACDNQAVRIDVGMSKGCGDGLPEVLEILRDSSDLRVFTSRPVLPLLYDTKIKHSQGLGLLTPEKGPNPIQVQA